MNCKLLWMIAAPFGLAVFLGVAAPGQNRQADDPAKAGAKPPTISRDNFGPQGGRLPRLSREALDKATEDDFAKEDEKEERAKPKAPSAAGKAAVPFHRFSRDAALHGTSAAASHKQAKNWQITLKNSFIEKYKNRATITAPYRVIAFRKHTPAEDGDAHVAGLSDEVGLACVAEIMNVKFFQGALTAVKNRAADGEMVSVTGAWRIWCEHPDAVPATAGPQIQDDVIPDFKTSNPNHVFEIHPVNRFGSIPLEESFTPIDGFTPYDAKKAFEYYESLTCTIVPDPQHQTTTLLTPKAKYNYAQFVIELEEDQQFVTIDGRITRASVLTQDGTVVAEHRRMIFVNNTPAEKAVRTKTKGDRMHVLGIPRIDLALVSYRTRVADSQPAVLGWYLPYEMIVVGVYDD